MCPLPHLVSHSNIWYWRLTQIFTLTTISGTPVCTSYYPILEFTGVLIKYWAQQHIHVKDENELSLQSVDENAGVEFHHSTWKPPGPNGTSRGQKFKGKVSVMPCFFADSGQNTSLLQLDTFHGPGLASAFSLFLCCHALGNLCFFLQGQQSCYSRVSLWTYLSL